MSNIERFRAISDEFYERCTATKLTNRASRLFSSLLRVSVPHLFTFDVVSRLFFLCFWGFMSTTVLVFKAEKNDRRATGKHMFNSSPSIDRPSDEFVRNIESELRDNYESLRLENSGLLIFPSSWLAVKSSLWKLFRFNLESVAQQ